MKRIVSFFNPKQKRPFHNQFLVMKRIFGYEKNCTTHSSGTVDGRWYTSLNKSDAVGRNNKDLTDGVGEIVKTMKKCDSVAQMKTRETERHPTYPLRLQVLAPWHHSRRMGSEEAGRNR